VLLLDVERVASGGVPGSIRLLIAPLLIQDLKGLQSRLTEYVRDGGLLVAGPYLLVYDEDGYVNPGAPPVPLRELAGAVRTDILYPDTPRLTILREPLTGLVLDGYHLLEHYTLEDGEPLAHTGRLVTATINKAGSGLVALIGSMLGSAYKPDRRGGLAMFLEYLASKAGCKLYPKCTGGVVRMAESDQGPVLFVFNPSNEQRDIWVKAGGHDKAVDLVSGDRLMAFKGYIRLRAAPRKAFILLLK